MFTKSQINELIKKILYIAQNNNDRIEVSSYEEAAQVCAYVAGYNSINEFLSSEENSSKDTVSIFKCIENNEEFKQEKEFKDITVNLNIEEIQNLNMYLSRYNKNKNQRNIKENINILSKLNIGYKYNPITKYSDNIFINTENTLFYSNSNLFFEKIKNDLMEQKQTIINLIESSKFDGETDNYLIDPINEIFNGVFLEEIFEDEILDHKGFIFVWFLMIQQIKEKFNINFNLELLYQTLDLDFVIKISTILAKDSNFLSSMILNYIKSLSNVVIEKNKIKIPKESVKKHDSNCKKLLSLFDYFDWGYKNNKFKINDNSLFSIMLEKKSININVENQRLFNLLLEKSISKYDKTLNGLEIKEHIVFILDDFGLIKKPIKSNYVIQFIRSDSNIKNNNFEDFNQILFSKQNSFTNFSNEFLAKVMNNSKLIEKNIFYANAQDLIYLEEKNGFIFKKTKPFEEVYELIKINA